MAFDPSLLGQPVELSQLPRELKKLWESTGGAKTRASLVNFVVYCQKAEALESNTRLISEFTAEHACRAMLLAGAPEAEQSKVRAWINAHCHLSRAGAMQICCEQITILLEGAAQRFLPNILFANLDSDLPLYLWWQGELTAQLNEEVATWIDRLIFDSQDWKNCREQLALLQKCLEHHGSRMILCDLNWTRTLHLRQALAQMFDNPDCLARIPALERMAVSHAPGFQSTALLFIAWVSAQFKWAFAGSSGGKITFRSPAGLTVACELIASEGAPISRCDLFAENFSVAISREAGSKFHRAEVHLPNGRELLHQLPAGGDEVKHLLDDELTFGGRHRVYLKALTGAGCLF